MSKKREKGRARKRGVVIVKANNLRPLPLSAKNEAQKQALNGLYHKSQVFLTGSPGTGKTHLAVISALNLIQQKKFDKVIVARSNTSFPSEDFGHLPGTLEEKIAPWIVPIKQSINTAASNGNAFAEYDRIGLIETQSLQHIKGTTVKNAVLIVDEAQNVKMDVMKSILTRHGANAKIVFCGDESQADIHNSPLLKIAKYASNEFPEFAHWTNFTHDDCVRSFEAKAWLKSRFSAW